MHALIFGKHAGEFQPCTYLSISACSPIIKRRFRGPSVGYTYLSAYAHAADSIKTSRLALTSYNWILLLLNLIRKMAQLGNIDAQRHDIFAAMYGGYTGAPALPMPVLLTSTFWDDQKILETLTPCFIRRHVSESLRKKMDNQLKFGEGLTDCTYADWIAERTSKVFLILVEIGAADKIFDIIDGSWDDDDLPLSIESLARLNMGTSLEKKFFKKQHLFMVRELLPQTHVDYKDDETVPLEVIYHRIPSTRSSTSVEKVYFPRQRGVYFTRRRVPIGDGPSQISPELLMEELNAMRNITHPHIVAIHATYTQGDYGYLVLSPTIDVNLRMFIQYPPSTFKSLTKDAQKLLLIDWMHCLSDAVAFLHEECLAHGDLKPSNIIIDAAHKIYLSDIGNSRALDPKPTSVDIEAYEYGAPELWVRALTSHEAPSSAVTFSGRIRRRSSTSSDSLPSSPVEKSIHLGAWKTDYTVDHSNSDVYSLGCIFADILTVYAKRKSSAFHSHRSARNRRPRESAPPDASFHANMHQVESWFDGIEKRARDKNDATLEGCIGLVHDMMHRDPAQRPRARMVEKELYKTVLGMSEEGLPHCGMHTIVEVDAGLGLFGGWDEDRASVESLEAVVAERKHHSFGDVKHRSFDEEVKHGFEEKLRRLGLAKRGPTAPGVTALIYAVG